MPLFCLLLCGAVESRAGLVTMHHNEVDGRRCFAVLIWANGQEEYQLLGSYEGEPSSSEITKLFNDTQRQREEEARKGKEMVAELTASGIARIERGTSLV